MGEIVRNHSSPCRLGMTLFYWRIRECGGGIGCSSSKLPGLRMVFVNELSPFLFRTELFGQEVGIRWYGLAYVIGFVMGYLAMRNGIRRGKLTGMEEKDLDFLITLIIGGVVLGGRLGYCLQHLDTWMKDPMFFFRFNQGGMAFFGGLAGVILALVIFSRKKPVKFADLGDVATLPAALGLGIGRIANFINGELWGVPTNASWGVIYPNSGDRQLRHPSELYEMLSHFALAGVLVWAGRTKWGQNRGALAAVFVLVYGLLRVITEHFRHATTYVGPLTNGQVASLVIAVLGGLALVLVLRAAANKPLA